jgi:hypothetical protein
VEASPNGQVYAFGFDPVSWWHFVNTNFIN